MNRAPILIAGGGIGGLALAVGLARAGLDVRVLERAEAYRPIGSFLGIWPRAIRVLRDLGVMVDPAGRLDIRRLRVMSSRGAHWCAFRVADAPYPPMFVLRHALQDALAARLGEHQIRMGAAVESFEASGGPTDPEVLVRLHDGTELRGRALVGADGIGSRVRTQLDGRTDERYCGHVVFTGTADLPEAVIPQQMSIFWGRGQRFVTLPISEDRVQINCMVACPEHTFDDRSNLAQRKRALLRRFQGWHESTPPLIRACSSLDLISIRERPPRLVLGSGPVTLIGDAAHATTPELGMGACMALEDAWVLSRGIGETPDIASAMRRYERRRLLPTWTTNRASRLATAWTMSSNPLVTAATAAGLRLLPDELYTRVFRRYLRISDGAAL